MARKKSFDRDAALAEAMRVFWKHGYEATSTDMLMAAMGIGRQSLYDTFGDKRTLYLEALGLYSAQTVSDLIARTRGKDSPLEALRAVLSQAAALPPDRRALGCIAVNAIGEFGQRDEDVLQAMAGGGSVLDLVLEDLVRQGMAVGEIVDSIKPESAVRFLLSVRSGLMTGARGGAAPEHLLDVAEIALNALRTKSSP
ncbi:TetR/AcrR family transcriptional regulator [Ralstonia insidiosa]|uniref:TetR/AcrR family transcriptional regulator n=1 Tax=Ralstonia insidiosa TaxID=190721 RepID=A0A848NXB0_9RALS|nr:TetR/AcrR family transcriptional regulator [Ralstonia insidiosa]NMV37116.1 TetR/AcrR family transcriptional regulator [Ralstonia insidiosa]